MVESKEKEILDGDRRDADFSELEEVDTQRSAETVTGRGDHAAGPGSQEQQLALLQTQVAEFREKYLRALAEMENYKKRALKDRADLLKYQGDKIFQDILPILDNLELALHHSDSGAEKLKSGVQLIQKMFVEVLSRWGVRAEPSVGLDFNPAVHAAISKLSDPNAKPGTVLTEIRKAYFYKDKLLRHADVVVADSPAEATQPQGDNLKSEDTEVSV